MRIYYYVILAGLLVGGWLAAPIPAAPAPAPAPVPQSQYDWPPDAYTFDCNEVVGSPIANGLVGSTYWKVKWALKDGCELDYQCALGKMAPYISILHTFAQNDPDLCNDAYSCWQGYSPVAQNCEHTCTQQGNPPACEFRCLLDTGALRTLISCTEGSPGWARLEDYYHNVLEDALLADLKDCIRCPLPPFEH